jgi:plasmid replication initiation protein
MAMALLPSDLSSLSVAFTFMEFCNALGYEKGGESYRIFNDAVDECMKSVIHVETTPNKKGKTGWVKHHWFQLAEFNKDTGVCTMIFDQKLADFLRELKWLYSRINLNDLGRLQSRYAIRIFELAISYSSFQGKDGNPNNTWYFERSLEELRKIFEVAPDEYKENKEFRRNVIENPVKEINNAGIGMEITTEGVKQGRNLKAIRINCKTAPRKTTTKKGRKKRSETEVQLELPGFSSKNADSRQEKELEHLKELYPEEFAELYQAELSKARSYASDELKQIAAEASALAELKKRHGIVK